MRVFGKLFRRGEPEKDPAPLDVQATDELWQPVYGYRLPLEQLAADVYRGLSFLVVDDNVDQLDIVGSFLKKYGGAVDFAENGQIGLGLFCAAPEKYTIIFMDIQMPVMDGGAAARGIRDSEANRAKTIPIVAMSGNIFRTQDKDAGFSFFLNKPFHMEQLAYAIDALQDCK